MGSLIFNQVKLVGFKSFVDPTEFIIRPGLTGIVGPNGCGKSNLLEAIRWVMGANSAKAMRATGMDDVIFNGTKTRPGRNQAHVTLTVDNKNRVAPPMFNDTDILEITRIITKGQGSKYQINGKTVRAKDVQLLFADASTGANSPALVRQGQINELIAAKPSNRRRILEEAAGISGLHSRRHEAELRLRAAETNLSRLDDVINQIDSQLLSLRRQSRQAMRYKRLAGEIREYKALLWLKRWSAAQNNQVQAQDNLKIAEADVQETAKIASELNRKVLELAEELAPKREEQIVAAAVVARLNAAKDQLTQDEQSAREEIDQLKARLDHLTTDLTRENNIIEDAQNAISRLSREYTELSQIEDMSSALSEAETQAQQAMAERDEVESRYNQLTRQDAERKAKHESSLRELSNLTAQLEKRQSEKSSTDTALQLLRAHDTGDHSRNLFSEAAHKALSALEAMRETEQEQSAQVSELEQEEQTARDHLAEARQKLVRLETEKTTLDKILARGSEVDWIPALSQVDVQKGYEQAFSVAIGDDLEAAIGETASLTWLGAKTPSQNLPKGTQSLLNFVKAPKELTPRLSQIGVVDDADMDALKSQMTTGQRLVTKSGYLVRWDGFEITAGAETSAAIRLAQQARQSDLDQEITQYMADVDQARTSYEQAKQARVDMTHSVKAARQSIIELQTKERQAHAALAQYETDIARQTAEEKALKNRLEQLEQEISDLTAQLTIAKQTSSLYDNADELTEQLSQISQTLLEARAKADDMSATWRSLKNEIEARNRRLLAVQTEKEDWERRHVTATERISTLEQRLERAQISLDAATHGPDQFEERRRNLFSELDEANARRRAADDALSLSESQIKSAENSAREADNAHNLAREHRAGIEVRLSASHERIEDISARIAEILSCNPDELKQHLGDLAPDSNLTEADIEKKLDRLQNERERLGGVNLRADVEVAEQEERLSAMNSERDDLVAAIARLREGIDELNSEGRERLLKAFDVVNGHFGRLFQTLFGGGEAAIALTESDDPLEAGLEVMARPPGKKLAQMSLMSGGEQALTATALIFAVFLSNPAPICVLDEVDAPLDDANVSRYCNLLDAMTSQTQTKFIAITHNPVTMSRMDRLFGVTMAEQGVSQLVSMELSSASQLVATG